MLNTPLTRRLASYRKQAADWRIKQPTYVHYHDWHAHVRHVNQCGGGSWQALADMKRYASKSDRAYYCDNWPAGIRDLGDADKVVRLDHTGWYADHDQNELVKGRVLQLPARDGKPCYVPGIYRTDSDGVTLWLLDQYDEKEDAARAADGYAEHDAEDCREHNAEFEAEQQTEELRGRIVEIRSEIRAIVREMKTCRALASNAPVLCKTLRDSIADLRHESHCAYKRIQKLADNPWIAVE